MLDRIVVTETGELSTFVHFLRALLLATQIQKARRRQEHGFEPRPSDGEGRERVTKAANDLDRLRIRLILTPLTSHYLEYELLFD